MVIDLPLVNDNVTNCDRYAQGLMGRCCGYGKKEHSVKVISSLRHASHYSKWYRYGIPPARPSAKTSHSSAGVTTKPTSAYDRDGKPSADDDEEPVDSVVDALHAMHVSKQEVEKKPRHKVKTTPAIAPATTPATVMKDEDYASDSGDDFEVPDYAEKDEDYASDSGDDVIQSDDDEFYDSLVVDWTNRSATFKASLKPVSNATMAFATQMMKDVLEEE